MAFSGSMCKEASQPKKRSNSTKKQKKCFYISRCGDFLYPLCKSTLKLYFYVLYYCNTQATHPYPNSGRTNYMDSFQITGVWGSPHRKKNLKDADVPNSGQSGMEPPCLPTMIGWILCPSLGPTLRLSLSTSASPLQSVPRAPLPSCPYQFVSALMYLWLPLQCLRLLHTYVDHKSAIEKDSRQEEGEMEKSVGGRVSA